MVVISREQCRQLAKKTLTDGQWNLIEDQDMFLDQMLAEAQWRLSKARHRPATKIIRDAAINCYNHVWYEACCAHKTLRQEYAFAELHEYVYCLALTLTDQDEYIASESTQEVLISILNNLHTLRDPGAFTKWVMQYVRWEVIKQWKKGMQSIRDLESGRLIWQSREVALSNLSESQVDLTNSWPMSLLHTSISSLMVITMDTRRQLEAAIRKCLRSKKQQETIILCFLDNKSHLEVANTLGTTPSNLSTLKSKALARLRECSLFLNTIKDLL